MNKHLKLFANHTAYEAAKNNIDKPNVVMCQQEGDIHYNKPAALITFQIIDNVYSTQYECHAEEGMTWGDWVESSYNTLGLDVAENPYQCYISKPNEDYVIFSDNTFNDTIRTSCSEQIVENKTYFADSLLD